MSLRATIRLLGVVLGGGVVLPAVPLFAMESLPALHPQTQVSADSLVAAPLHSASLATAELAGVPYAVRSGRRITGLRPAFPSALLILSRNEGGTWRDIAWVDDTPESELGDVTLAAQANQLKLTYRLRTSEGKVLEKGVQVSPEALAVPTPSAPWTALPDFPQPPGVAGLIAGVHQGVLIAAGGANFPDRMPWEGGVKQYYDRIYVLRPGDKAWSPAGTLPTPRGYSAVVSLPNGVLVIGGENGPTLLSDVLLLQWTGSGVAIRQAAALPVPLTSGAAVVANGRVYLAGGYAPGEFRTSRSEFWSLDLEDPNARWQSLPSWPGPPRAMATIAALRGSIYLLSGLEVKAGADGKAQSTYLVDAYRYDRDETWTRLPDLPWSTIAAPSPAPVDPVSGRIFVLGGVDGRQVGKMPREAQVPEDILAYDAPTGAWHLWPQRWPQAVVTTPTFAQGNRWYFISGEIKAGVRTTAAWSWQLRAEP